MNCEYSPNLQWNSNDDEKGALTRNQTVHVTVYSPKNQKKQKKSLSEKKGNSSDAGEEATAIIDSWIPVPAHFCEKTDFRQ